MAHQFHPSIVRAYDVRGIVDETFSEQDCYWLGKGFATHAAEQYDTPSPRITVLRDGRNHSMRLARALMQGLKESGAQVYNAGIGPTPMGYFSAYRYDMHGVIIVTGSHNPPEYNGLKFMLGQKSFYADSLIGLARRVETSALLKGSGTEQPLDLAHDYIRTLLAASGADIIARPLRVAWDAGNGAAGDMIELLCECLPLHAHGLLFTRLDGNFPNHHPDPTDPATLKQLQEHVRSERCDVGFAFDGDGDRLGIIDNQGRIVSPDHTLMLLSDDVLEAQPGATIIADVKTSNAVFTRIHQHGGRALMWKTGHALIKHKMAEVGAAFGGEASGHLFFADRYFGYDDALYAALRVIGILARRRNTLAAHIDALPAVFSSPEIRIATKDSEKFAQIAALESALKARGAHVDTLDGVRVSVDGGWWLLRASNTQAALVGRIEAEDETAYPAVLAHLQSALESCGLTL